MFGFNQAATNHVRWVVMRSLDLITDPFTEIFRLDGPSGQATTNTPLTINMTSDAIQITDDTIPQPPIAAYHLVVEPNP